MLFFTIFEWMHTEEWRPATSNQSPSSPPSSFDSLSSLASSAVDATGSAISAVASNLSGKSSHLTWTDPTPIISSERPQFKALPLHYLLAFDIPGIPSDELALYYEVKKSNATSPDERQATLYLQGEHLFCIENVIDSQTLNRPPPPSRPQDRQSKQVIEAHCHHHSPHWCLSRKLFHQLNLPDDVQLEAIDAFLKDGVLVVKLPRIDPGNQDKTRTSAVSVEIKKLDDTEQQQQHSENWAKKTMHRFMDKEPISQ